MGAPSAAPPSGVLGWGGMRWELLAEVAGEPGGIAMAMSRALTCNQTQSNEVKRGQTRSRAQ